MSSVGETQGAHDLLLAALDQSGLAAFSSSSLSRYAENLEDSEGGMKCDEESGLLKSTLEAAPRKNKRYARITVDGRKFLIPTEKKVDATRQILVPTIKEPFVSTGCAKYLWGQGKAITAHCGDAPSAASCSVESTLHHDELELQTTSVRLTSNSAKFRSKVSTSELFTKDTQSIFKEDEEQEVEETEDTYADYKPSKLGIGLPHPDAVVETSSLSSIPPPDISYKLLIPSETIDNGWLSALQLESITYACQKHLELLPSGERAGFLIGDGAGVGKGRTIAGIIFENYLLGRKRALWFSVSSDLKYDSERDLRDIGADYIQVHMLNKFKYGKISSKENSSVKKGIIFATYSSLISESHSTSRYGTRLKQILQWCGSDFDGVIIFDECHKAKNLVPSGSTKSTKTGSAVMELQKRLPKARVVYASATGASEPRNMAYMSRIGLWGKGTPFLDFGDFIQTVERRGVGAMELVAMDLKSRGSYIARQLSFQGVSFKIEEIKLPDSFIQMYNKAVALWTASKEAFQIAAEIFGAENHMKKAMWRQFWAAHQRFFKHLCIAAKVERASQISREALKHGKCVVIGLQSTGEAGTLDELQRCDGVLDDFVSTARGVFRNLMERHFPAPNRKRVTDLFGQGFYEVNKNLSLQKSKKLNQNCKAIWRIPHSEFDSLSGSSDDSVDYSDEDISKIFGAESDFEDCGFKPSQRKKKRENDDWSWKFEADQTQVILAKHIESFSQTSNCPKYDTESSCEGDCDPISKVQALKQDLLEKLENIELPNNALDDLIDKLGGSENVAEMTGRKGRIVHSDGGQIQYQSRAEREVNCNLLNITEKQRFMNGEKNIAIISDATSSGISLQSDRRVQNQRRRLHVTLELPWSADRAVQQFGRTHRSNQVTAPDYLFLITELAGERRFASIVAKRLETLGALTHGDRRATETKDLSRYNFDNKYGKIALNRMMKSLIGAMRPLALVPSSYPGDFYTDIRKALLSVGLISKETSIGSSQLEKESYSIRKFLNRILGMEVLQQNAVFSYFSDTMSSIVRQAKADGQIDQGIKDIGSGQDLVEHVDTKCFELKYDGSSGRCYVSSPSLAVKLHTVKVDRGLSWERAQSLFSETDTNKNDGFYLSRLRRNGNRVAVLCIEDSWTNRSSKAKKYEERLHICRVYRPNVGRHTRETSNTFHMKFEKASFEDAEEWWLKQYHASINSCSHLYLQGSCHSQTHLCTTGKRQLTYHILSGSVLAVWKVVEHVLMQATSLRHKIQIVRFVTKDGSRLVGLLIPEHSTEMLIKFLHSFDSILQDVTEDKSCNAVATPWINSSKDEEEADLSPDDFMSSVLHPRYSVSE